MEHIVMIRDFNQIAITNKLTGLQMQLWYEIFARVQASAQDLYISTAELLEVLQVSRCQFQRARSGLLKAGLLSMRKLSNQKVFYTIQLHHEPVVLRQVSETAFSNEFPASSKPNPANRKHAQKTTPKETTKSIMYPKSADVIADNSYRKEIIKFCENLRIENVAGDVLALETELMNWGMMRKENGWRLTMQGLNALLQKLKDLSAQNISAMLEIVRTSIRRRWKGFYELRPESKPSGKKLLAIEQKNDKSSYWEYRNTYSNKQTHKSVGRLPKYDTKKEDLDFLEW